MHKTVEAIVSLKVHDNTALTALQALHSLGFSQISDLSRADYYLFTIEGDIDKFKERISKVDVIVNANKHSISFSVADKDSTKVIVTDTDADTTSLVSLLKNRLGLKEVKKISKGVMWSLYIKADDAKSIANDAAKQLLANENYQEFKIL